MIEETAEFVQPLLIHVVDNDDIYLKHAAHADWFRTLRDFRWEDYRELGAQYYEQLYVFNERAAQKRGPKPRPKTNREKREEAQLRLLEDRPAGGNEEAPILQPEAKPAEAVIRVDPETIRPGETPIRMAGKRPKCFFSMFLAFIGVSLMGRPAEVDVVFEELQNNPAFARVCGFTLPAPPKPSGRVQYRHMDIPMRRKIQQFDQIMTESGLWSQAKWDEVERNRRLRVFVPEPDLVHDTTHFDACSQFEVVKGKTEDGKERRKSQSKTIKKCRCKDRETCPHPWELADDGAGTVVKQRNQKHWAHKAAVVGLPRQGVPVDAVAVADAATHDGETLVPHLERLYEHVPELIENADRVLADSAYDSDRNREAVAAPPFELRLCASLNPRSAKARTEGLPRGMAKVTPYGDVVCQAGYLMEYRGVRKDTGRFIYGSPRDEDGEPLCRGCPFRSACLNEGSEQRTVTIPFELLPHINPNDPPMSQRWKRIMKLRPTVERMIKNLKCDHGDGRAHKRGNASFQARMDKTMIAIHIQLRKDKAIG